MKKKGRKEGKRKAKNFCVFSSSIPEKKGKKKKPTSAVTGRLGSLLKMVEEKKEGRKGAGCGRQWLPHLVPGFPLADEPLEAEKAGSDLPLQSPASAKGRQGKIS